MQKWHLFNPLRTALLVYMQKKTSCQLNMCRSVSFTAPTCELLLEPLTFETFKKPFSASFFSVVHGQIFWGSHRGLFLAAIPQIATGQNCDTFMASRNRNLWTFRKVKK